VLDGIDECWLQGKLQLEPLSGARDVEYLVLTPEVNLTVDNINLFMKELSQVYEDYHFGKHTAVPKLRNGIMKIGKKLLTHSAVADQTPDKWFSTLGLPPSLLFGICHFIECGVRTLCC
jgi:hypothetical protein